MFGRPDTNDSKRSSKVPQNTRNLLMELLVSNITCNVMLACYANEDKFINFWGFFFVLLCSAKEWLGHNTAPRQVTLAFNEKKVFQTFDENGSLLSSHSFGNQEHLKVIIPNDHQHRSLLLKIPKEYDLVRIRLFILLSSCNECSMRH